MAYWTEHVQAVFRAGSRLLELLSTQGGGTNEDQSTDNRDMATGVGLSSGRRPRIPMGEPPNAKQVPAARDAEEALRQDHTGVQEDVYDRITDAGLNHDISPNTMKNYRAQWRRFALWADERQMCALPASSSLVAEYLHERAEQHGSKPPTLRMAAAAIGFAHRADDLNSPCSATEVKRVLRRETRKTGRSQKQAEAITTEEMTFIRRTAFRRRRTRGGNIERPASAKERGRRDIALIGLMRDAMLRVSAAALTWGDLEVQLDGTGRLRIRRSKTDTEGEGALLFVSAQTVKWLSRLPRATKDTDSIFGLRPNQISRRIKEAARAAVLGNGFSGHSPRVGMARDLARAGMELPGLMTAGRWRTPTMPAHYIRRGTAGRGAVAQFYGYNRKRVGG